MGYYSPHGETNQSPESVRARGMSQTTASLLERLSSHDRAEAWGRLVDLYTPFIYFWACRTGLKAADAAEVVQDVFETLAGELPNRSHRNGPGFRDWLRTLLVQRLHANRLAHAAAMQHTETVAVAEAVAPDGPEALWDAEYRRHLVGRTLEIMHAEFPRTVWQACWRLVVEGKSAPQIASELGLEVEAVYAAKAQVLRRVRQELDGLLE
jgi:RNA polymerase sigma-70 factor (ECF subfamily)